MTTYKKDIVETTLHNRMITVINLTPEFSYEERTQIKKNIERKLYDVFFKYFQSQI